MESINLSISNHKMDCAEVVKLMQQAGIVGSVTKTHSVVCSGKKLSCSRVCTLEPGCRIVGLKDGAVKDLWEKTQKHFDLTCAHVSRPGVFSGCIHDYLAASRCPG